MPVLTVLFYVVAAVVAVAVAAAVLALALGLLLGAVALGLVVGAVGTAVFSVGFVVVAICRAWMAVLRDDELGHLRVAPPDPLPPGRDPAYLGYYFGPAWRDYGLATARGAREVQVRTVVRSPEGNRSVLDMLLHAWAMPDGLELGAVLIAKTVLAGFVAGGLLGLAVAGLVSGTFVAVTTAVFGLLLGVVVAVLLLVCGVLRAVELALLRLRGITVECPSCHQRVGVPVYECPHCQELHRRLVPGSAGVLSRICRCGTELPTLLARGRSRLRAHCGHDDCRGVLPLGGLSVPTRHVPVVAGRVAGKTVHVMAAVADLRAQGDDTGFEFGDEHTTTTFAQVESRLQDLAGVPATIPTAPLRAATFYLGTGSARRLMYLYDAAGERYQSSERMAGLRFLGAAAGILLVVDPFALTSVRGRMVADDVALPAHSTEPPGDVLGRMTAGLREQDTAQSRGRITVPVAVVLTKCDVLVHGGPVPHPYEKLAAADTARDRRSEAVKGWLDGEAGEGGLVRQLHTDYATVGYFAVSALDAFGEPERVSGRTGRPVRNDPPSAPLRWLLDTAGAAR